MGGARHVDEDLGVLLLLQRVRFIESGVDIRRGAELQRYLDEPVDLHVVALGVAAAPARPRAAAPSATAANGVMTKFFISKPFCGSAICGCRKCCLASNFETWRRCGDPVEIGGDWSLMTIGHDPLKPPR